MPEVVAETDNGLCSEYELPRIHRRKPDMPDGLGSSVLDQPPILSRLQVQRRNDGSKRTGRVQQVQCR